MTPTHLPLKRDIVTAINMNGLAVYATSDAHLDAGGFVKAKRTRAAPAIPDNQVCAEINRIEHGRREWG